LQGQAHDVLSVWIGSPASPVMLVGNVLVDSPWNYLEKTAAVLILSLQTHFSFSKFRELKD